MSTIKVGDQVIFDYGTSTRPYMKWAHGKRGIVRQVEVEHYGGVIVEPFTKIPEELYAFLGIVCDGKRVIWVPYGNVIKLEKINNG